MIYFANPTGDAAVHDAMSERRLGMIRTPKRQGSDHLPVDPIWCADNGCFSERFEESRWWAWLQRYTDECERCLFAAAPDVVGDAAATLARSAPWLPRIRSLGYPAAYVAQDGIESTVVPWDEFDVLFIGGTTAFKLGIVARRLVGEALRRDKWVHLGRCNSLRRYRYAEAIGAESADGTFLIYGPRINLPRMLRWQQQLDDQPALFRLIEGQA
jgi:hypothetical protein